MKKKLNIIVLIISIIVLFFGYTEYDKYIKEHNNFIKINAKVDSIELNGDRKVVTFLYNIDGKEYTSNITTNENLEIGNTKDIYYDKNSPTNTKLELMTIYKSLLILIGGLLILILALYLNLTKLFYSSRKKRLLKKGILINAEIQEVVVVPKDKGRNPYKVRATYTNFATNDKYFYESEEDFTDLKDIVSRKNITKVPVYINPKNGNDYYVDIESLKK